MYLQFHLSCYFSSFSDKASACTQHPENDLQTAHPPALLGQLLILSPSRPRSGVISVQGFSPPTPPFGGFFTPAPRRDHRFEITNLTFRCLLRSARRAKLPVTIDSPRIVYRCHPKHLINARSALPAAPCALSLFPARENMRHPKSEGCQEQGLEHPCCRGWKGKGSAWSRLSDRVSVGEAASPLQGDWCPLGWLWHLQHRTCSRVRVSRCKRGQPSLVPTYKRTAESGDLDRTGLIWFWPPREICRVRISLSFRRRSLLLRCHSWALRPGLCPQAGCSERASSLLHLHSGILTPLVGGTPSHTGLCGHGAAAIPVSRWGR